MLLTACGAPDQPSVARCLDDGGIYCCQDQRCNLTRRCNSGGTLLGHSVHLERCACPLSIRLPPVARPAAARGAQRSDLLQEVNLLGDGGALYNIALGMNQTLASAKTASGAPRKRPAQLSTPKRDGPVYTESVTVTEITI